MAEKIPHCGVQIVNPVDITIVYVLTVPNCGVQIVVLLVISQ